MKNLILGFFLLLAFMGCKKNPPPQTQNCDHITSIDQLPWLKDLAEGKTDCKIYPYASITKFNNNDTTVFFFRNPGYISDNYFDKNSWAYFNCEGKQISRPTNLTNELLLWQAKSSSPNNCDEVTSIDQLPWAKELVSGVSAYFPYNAGLINPTTYFSKCDYNGKTVFQYHNPPSASDGTRQWAIFDCIGNIILHSRVATPTERGDFFTNKTNEKILWKF
jgi:hypothetical protein